MRALCVGRHRLLSDHLTAYFRSLGLDCVSAVGIEEAVAAARCEALDLVICDYDLIASRPLGARESDGRLADLPLVAVSLTRRRDEAHLLDVRGITGFLYLPTLDRAVALRVLAAARRAPAVPSLRWDRVDGVTAR